MSEENQDRTFWYGVKWLVWSLLCFAGLKLALSEESATGVVLAYSCMTTGAGYFVGRLLGSLSEKT
jgi:hypothetical protein